MTQVLKLSKTKSFILASRPRTLILACIPILMATLLAYKTFGSFNAIILFSALFAATFIQIGTNLINDALDFKKGADTKERVGFLRATQSGLLSFNEVYFAGLFCFALALLMGLPLMIKGGFFIVLLLAVSVLCGYFYTGGPFPLAYKGLGEVFVLLFFGWVSTNTIYYLQTGEVNALSFLLSTQIGLLATVPIAINNCRDEKGDYKANKRTLAVRFGEKFAKAEIAFLLLAPFALNLLWIIFNNPLAALLPFLVLPLALKVIWNVYQETPGPSYNRFFVLGVLVAPLFNLALFIAL